MEDTPHCLLAGEGALKFAKKIGFPVVEDPLVLITAESYERSANAANYVETVEDYNAGNLKPTDSAGSSQGFDTVGAVAFDSHGQLASATSTGGLPMKMPGRVGDSPLVGCGGYANTVAASSTTGHGESLMKTVLAWEVVRNVEDGLEPKQACEKSIDKMAKSVKGVGGVIALNNHGEFGLAFSSKHMTWAFVSKHTLKFGQELGEEQDIPV